MLTISSARSSASTRRKADSGPSAGRNSPTTLAAVYIMASSSVVEDVLAVAAVARKFLQSLKTKIKEGEKEGRIPTLSSRGGCRSQTGGRCE